MRRRVRSRVLTSVRTAMRNFDLELAIATSRPAKPYVEIGTIPVVHGSNRSHPFAGGRARVSRYVLQNTMVPQSTNLRAG